MNRNILLQSLPQFISVCVLFIFSYAHGQQAVYEWGIIGRGVQGNLTNTFVNKDGFNVYSQPEVPCDASKNNQIIAVDFGYEVVPMICMTAGNDEHMQKYLKLTKNVDLAKLAPIVINKNEKYNWVIETPAAPLNESQQRICTAPSTPCHGKVVGNLFSAEAGCARLKCVRTDNGGPINIVKAKEVQNEDRAARSNSRMPAGLNSGG